MAELIDYDEELIKVNRDYGVLMLPYGELIINRHDKLLPTNLHENIPEIAELTKYCNGVVVDIGANIGSHSINFSRVATVVYAFEPQPRIYYNLCANLLINNVYNVVVINSALGNENGITHVPALDGTQPGSPMGVPVGVGSQEVPIHTLDSYCIRDINFIKIDVEGHELEVLRGAACTLADEDPIVYVEIHRLDLIDPVCDFMSAFHYKHTKYIEVHTIENEQDIILTTGYLFWKGERVQFV